jgi:hypothetical protein
VTRATRVSYDVELDGRTDVVMYVDFQTSRDEVIDYAIVLTLRRTDAIHNVRLYDGAHGVNELHRYTRSGIKQHAETFHPGTLGEGMRWAIAEIKRRYQMMIDSWTAQT